MADAERGVEMPKMKISPELMQRLREHAAKTGGHMTWHRRRALEQYLDREAPVQRDH